ncbi:MAG: hypothetical protein QOJ15_1493 [Bradyrhizobium sp.]|jgi:hypothetical protein|nr:hypothetical protein [Bradyrhizobium sp.]
MGSVQLIDTRKIVALIAVIDRMKTTLNPVKKADTINGKASERLSAPFERSNSRPSTAISVAASSVRPSCLCPLKFAGGGLVSLTLPK